jgi:hypothetical protein
MLSPASPASADVIDRCHLCQRSDPARRPYTVGASASIFGLLGALVYYGKRGGSSMIGSQAWSMALFMFIFGFVMSGVDNYAHAGGFAGGYLTAMWLDPLKQERVNHLLGAVICLALSLLAIMASVIDMTIRFRSRCPIASDSLIDYAQTVVLITGASGEIGHGLIERLADDHSRGHRHARSRAARSGAGEEGAARGHRIDPRQGARSSGSSRSSKSTRSITSPRCSRRARSSRR